MFFLVCRCWNFWWWCWRDCRRDHWRSYSSGTDSCDCYPGRLAVEVRNMSSVVWYVQAVLFLPLKCAGGIILGTSLPPPPPPPPLLLLLNHSQCASLNWPKTERERKLLVRDNILIPRLTILTAQTVVWPQYSLHQLIHNTLPCTHVQQTYWVLVITTYSKHSIMTMTLKNILHVMWPSWIEANYYSILYLRAPPHLKCCITGLLTQAQCAVCWTWWYMSYFVATHN